MKSKPTAADATEQPTPRTRGALAREAAAKAKRDAEEAELKAAAAREEVEATRNEFASSVPEPSEEAALEPMALAVINAPEPIQTTPQQKGHCLQHLFPNINSFVQCVYLFSWQGTILRW